MPDFLGMLDAIVSTFGISRSGADLSDEEGATNNRNEHTSKQPEDKEKIKKAQKILKQQREASHRAAKILSNTHNPKKHHGGGSAK